MSWWTDFRDSAEKIGTFGIYDPAKSRQNEADQRYMMNDQIQAYKDQTEIAKAATDKAAGEVEAEKRRINEKQIRGLRNKFRPAGFLNNQSTQSPVSSTITNKLGG